jgi:hypothetical protein
MTQLARNHANNTLTIVENMQASLERADDGKGGTATANDLHGEACR